MPYTITPTDAFTHVAWHGVLEARDIESIGKELAVLAQRHGRMSSVLHTFDQVTEVNMEPIVAYRQSLRRNEMHVPNRMRAASVATSPTVFAYARLFEELNRNPMIEMRVFEARESAIAWLTEPVDAAQ